MIERIGPAVGLVAFLVSGCGGSERRAAPDHSSGSGATGGSGGTDDAGGSGGLGDADVTSETAGSGGSSGAAGTGGWGGTGGWDGTADQEAGDSPDAWAGLPEGEADGPDSSADAAVPPRYPPIRISDIGTPVLIGNQFTFSEGPVWDPTKGVLFFSDITANRIYRLTLPSTFDVFHAPSNQTDGLALDVQGNLIAAEFGTRSVARLVGAGESTLANQYMAKKLNTPDDLISRSDGIVYFTDPGFGLGAGGATYGLPTNTVSELGFDGVYRLLPDGTLYLEDQSSGQAPNGVELSPDERTLYVSYTRTGQIVSFDVATDGSLSNKVPFSQPLTGADSMCVDAAGNVYVAGSSSGNGIGIYQGNGTWIGGIPRPSAQVPTNCAFGGVDQKTLFITARKEIYRIDNMPIPGMPGRP